jgi:uncharacterized membrane protein (UPF0127 family)
VLEPATQVHTFGMRYPIDALFCDEDWVVLHIVRAMAPWRLSRWVRGSRFVVEFAGGTLGRRVSPGARLVLERDPASAS